jgi:hypothetical protein
VRLPVEPERLRRRYPSLSDEDLAAFAQVSARVLGAAGARGRVLADVMSAAQRAAEKEAAGASLDAEERTALLYARALTKMQDRAPDA